MKVPGGWKDFFKNSGIASVLIYGVHYLIGSDPSIGSAIVWALILCSLIAFVESRLKGSAEETAQENGEDTPSEESGSDVAVEKISQDTANGY